MKNYTVLLRKILGFIIIFSVIYLISLESGIIKIGNSETTIVSSNRLINGLIVPYQAPAIGGIDAWINSPPLTMEQLKGKVVLIDFWTYSCINCLRTLPYIKSWYDKYHDKGLVIIGIHAPEFDFEKKLANVQNAVKQFGIKYPVALDNKFVTWRNYQNRYWPAHYLIDKNGYVVYTHFGEGEYGATESNIRYLLNINDDKPMEKEEAPSVARDITPETYLGYARAENYAGHDTVQPNVIGYYSFPETLTRDAWALQGNWQVMADKIVSAGKNVSIKLHYKARHVYAVMGNTTDHAIEVKVKLNNHDLMTGHGEQVINSAINVDKFTLYEIIADSNYDEGTLELTAALPGLEIYTFTFG